MTGESDASRDVDPARREGSPHSTPRRPQFVDRHGVEWLVRPFEPADREPLLETYRDFDPDERAMGLPPADETRLQDWLDVLLEEGRNFVATREEEGVVGHAAYTPTGDPEPELAVFVHQEYQSRGLGTELCRHVVAAAAAAGCDALVLDVKPGNSTAIGIYERLGFERIDDAGDALGRRTHAVRMRLPFPSAATESVQQQPEVSG